MKPDRHPHPKQDDRNTGETGRGHQDGRDADDDHGLKGGHDRDTDERDGGMDRGGRHDDRGRTGGTTGGTRKQR
ncbi:MAG TPA: hypothetical protein VK123_07590 [Candidatus Limnocylindrales bacterium]|nr:hypothetical protein [Candidatus Limnocylindrales bacterium]